MIVEKYKILGACDLEYLFWIISLDIFQKKGKY